MNCVWIARKRKREHIPEIVVFQATDRLSFCNLAASSFSDRPILPRLCRFADGKNGSWCVNGSGKGVWIGGALGEFEGKVGLNILSCMKKGLMVSTSYVIQVLYFKGCRYT